MSETPEQKARREIDADLTAAGWLVQDRKGIGAAEAKPAGTLKSAHNLRQAILRYAFTGQLVRQDPNDEPASELLKRIAAEREERRAPIRHRHRAAS